MRATRENVVALLRVRECARVVVEAAGQLMPLVEARERIRLAPVAFRTEALRMADSDVEVALGDLRVAVREHMRADEAVGRT